MRKFAALFFGSVIWVCGSCGLLAAEAKYPISDDTVVILQSGNCEMGCPVFRVMIFANGDVVYQGRHHVRNIGLKAGHIEPDQIREILDEAQRIDYFHLQNIYGLHGEGCERTLPDQPLVVTSIAMDGRARTLTHHRGCVSAVSQSLSSLEDHINKVTGLASSGN
jgi:hypothetical protein